MSRRAWTLVAVALVGLAAVLVLRGTTAADRRAAAPTFAVISYGPGTAEATATIRRLRPTLVDVSAETSPALVNTIRASVPRARVLTYFSVVAAAPGVNDATGKCLPWRGGAPDGGVPAGELLHDADGRPLTLGGELLLDYGLPAVARACAHAMAALAHRQGVQGVYLDLVNARLFAGADGPNALCPGGSVTCTSDTAAQRAWNRFLTAVSARLHAEGLLLVANIAFGDAPCAGATEDCWRAWSRITDGAMEESFLDGAGNDAGCTTPAVPTAPAQTFRQLADLAWSERNRRYAIVNSDLPLGDVPSLRRSLAAALLVAGAWTSWNATHGCYGRAGDAIDALLASPTWAAVRRLGAARGSLSAHGGVLERRFAHGTVVVDLPGRAARAPDGTPLGPGSVRLG